MNNEERIELFYKAGMKNPWCSGKAAKDNGDSIVEEDRLNRKSLVVLHSLEELIDFFKKWHSSYTLGHGVILKDICFIQQIPGGDEWLCLSMDEGKKEAKPFESWTFEKWVKDGSIGKLMTSLVITPHEERLKWNYRKVDEKKLFRCPRCQGYSCDYPALSRGDNRTDICSNCGSEEALQCMMFSREDFLKLFRSWKG